MTRRLPKLPRRLRARSGMTLIELLLSLALMALVAAFVAAGLSTTRKGAEGERAAERAERADESLAALGALVADAVPVEIAKAGGRTTVAFDGQEARLSFVAAGDGLALRGGLWAVEIAVEDGVLAATLTPVREGERLASGTGDGRRRVPLASAAGRLSLAYFCAAREDGPPGWSDTWTDRMSLPRLVRLTLAAGAEPAASVVEIRRR